MKLSDLRLAIRMAEKLEALENAKPDVSHLLTLRNVATESDKKFAEWWEKTGRDLVLNAFRQELEKEKASLREGLKKLGVELTS